MTIDDLAVLIQSEFREVHKEMATKVELSDLKIELKQDIASLREDIYMLGGRLTSLEERVSSLERNVKILEEKMENGFHAIMLELRDIRRQLKIVDQREEVDELSARMDAVEQKIGMG